ncbi:MAG: sugar phosphate nucleotidyltransferase [bacterium]
MDRNLVILAGGASSRMKKSVDADSTTPDDLAKEVRTKPKAMLTVGSRPFLDFLLLNIEKAGYENVVIVVGEKDNSIYENYQRNNGARGFRQLRFSFVPQIIPAGLERPLGTADALLQALNATPSWTGKHFTACNSDNLYSETVLRLLLEDNHANAMIDYDRSTLLFPEERIAQFAIIRKDKDGFLEDIIEKPSPDELKHACDSHGRLGVSMNIWRLSYDMILSHLKAAPLHHERHEKELPVAVQMLVRQSPKSVFTIPRSEHVIDLTSRADISIVRKYLKEHFPPFN